MFPDTATVVETGPGGRQQADYGWGAVLADGTPVRVFLTAKVQTTGIAVLSVGQVIHIARSPWDAGRCAVNPSDFKFVSPSKLAHRIERPAEPSRAPDPVDMMAPSRGRQ